MTCRKKDSKRTRSSTSAARNNRYGETRSAKITDMQSVSLRTDVALILAAAAVSPGNSTFSRFNVLVPVSACVVGTVVYALAYIWVLLALDVVVRLPFFSALNLASDTPLRVPFFAVLQYTVLPSVAYNAAIMLVLTPILNRIPEAQDVGS